MTNNHVNDMANGKSYTGRIVYNAACTPARATPLPAPCNTCERNRFSRNFIKALMVRVKMCRLLERTLFSVLRGHAVIINYALRIPRNILQFDIVSLVH